MKLLNFSISLLLIVASFLASAQDPIVERRLNIIGQKFEKLTLEARLEYVRLKGKAEDANKKEKCFTCMVAISDARAIFPDDINIIWLQGACFAQIHAVDAAIGYYNEVLKIDPHHAQTLTDLVEINFFAGRFEETIKHIDYVNKIMKGRGEKPVPLFNFKSLISKVKLAEKDPDKYGDELKRLYDLHTYMEDNPYYYYANALKEFDLGNTQEGQMWIRQAYFIFDNRPLIETWNKALVDSGFIGAHEIMFSH